MFPTSCSPTMLHCAATGSKQKGQSSEVWNLQNGAKIKLMFTYHAQAVVLLPGMVFPRYGGLGTVTSEFSKYRPEDQSPSLKHETSFQGKKERKERRRRREENKRRGRRGERPLYKGKLPLYYSGHEMSLPSWRMHCFCPPRVIKHLHTYTYAHTHTQLYKDTLEQSLFI